MQKTKFMRILSLILCTVLIAAMTQLAAGCGDSGEKGETVTITDGSVFGEGAVSFTFSVTDAEGKEVSCTVKTDKKTVGDALLENKLIAGDNGQYGLYIKVVNGITADYDIDGTYWAFYVNGEYASGGVDTTEITEGAVYSLKVEG